MAIQGKQLILACLILLALSLLVASPAQAHGGEGDELQGAPAPWVVALTTIQLLLLPAIGLWLTREALAAWRPQRPVHQAEGYEP